MFNNVRNEEYNTYTYILKILKCWNHLSIKIFVNKCLNVRWRQFVDMPPFRKWSNMSYMSGLERGEVMRGEEEWPGIRRWPQQSSGECQESMLECGTSCRVNWGGDTCDTWPVTLTLARGTVCIRRSDIRSLDCALHCTLWIRGRNSEWIYLLGLYNHVELIIQITSTHC